MTNGPDIAQTIGAAETSPELVEIVDRLADALEEASLQVSDGTRPIDPDDAKQIAEVLIYGTDSGAPVWLNPAGMNVLSTFTVNEAP